MPGIQGCPRGRSAAATVPAAPCVAGTWSWTDPTVGSHRTQATSACFIFIPTFCTLPPPLLLQTSDSACIKTWQVQHSPVIYSDLYLCSTARDWLAGVIWGNTYVTGQGHRWSEVSHTWQVMCVIVRYRPTWAGMPPCHAWCSLPLTRVKM